MNNWLCIKDRVVVNILFAEEKYMMTDQDIGKTYDSYLNRDTMPIPKPIIGSYLNDNKEWVVKPITDLSKTDFSNKDLKARDFSFCDLTGCNFTGAIIDGCCFNDTAPTYSLAGAIYNGKIIKQGPVQVKSPYYFMVITDIFGQADCSDFLTFELPNYTAQQLAAMDPKFPDKPAKTWEYIKDDYLNIISKW